MRKQVISFIILSFCLLLSSTSVFAQQLTTNLDNGQTNLHTLDVRPTVSFFEARNGVKVLIGNARTATIRIYNPDGSLRFARTVRGNSTININTSKWQTGAYHVEVVTNGEYINEYTLYKHQ